MEIPGEENECALTAMNHLLRAGATFHHPILRAQLKRID